MKLLQLLIGLASAALPTIAPAATVTIVCGGEAGTFEPCREGAQMWAQATGNQVRVIPANPSSSSTGHLYRQLLSAQAEDVDVLEIQIDSAGTLAKHLLDLKSIPVHADEHNRGAVEAFTVNGRLVGVPWYLNVGRLFYRRDLLEKYELAVPRTWEELGTSAHIVQEGERVAGHSEFSGYVFQGRASEELTVDAVEWFRSYGGPGVVAADGTVVVDDPLDKAALTRAVTWLGSIAPLSVLNMGSTESLRFFMDGNAAFLRYQSSGFVQTEQAASLVRGRIGMADLPTRASERHHPLVIGGFGLAVSRYSKVPELASDLVAWLTGVPEEKRRALAARIDPSRPALYADPELAAAYPYYPALRVTLSAASSGPSRIIGRKYGQASVVLSEAVHRALARQATPSAALDEAAAALRGMSSNWKE